MTPQNSLRAAQKVLVYIEKKTPLVYIKTHGNAYTKEQGTFGVYEGLSICMYTRDRRIDF